LKELAINAAEADEGDADDMKDLAELTSRYCPATQPDDQAHWKL
jgi:hypothetical protein